MTTPRKMKILEDFAKKIFFEMPEVTAVEENIIKFDGLNFYKGKYGYYYSCLNLHKEIWRYFYGEIPPYYEIHHKDFDKK